jgi:acetyltransferase-like isoleucine patch superfamily enzyme
VRENAVIGENCILGKSVYIDEGVEVGSNVKIQNRVSIYKGVVIEDDVFLGPHVVFTNDYRPRAFKGDFNIVQTVVRKGASIGANSTILCGVEVGEYAMVGAGTMVSKDVPPFALVYGNPARLRGFVCKCGEKLEEGKPIKDVIVFKCPCGLEIEIDKKLFEMLE